MLKNQPKRAAVYARYSSNNQREESITAQLRAIRKYCDDNGILIVNTYTDEAKTGTTTDGRDEFLRMIEDAKSGAFDSVIVHKLDRFARNRHDSIGFRFELKKLNVSLISVLENIDGESPESIILESVLEGLNEYYSANLSREVMKGMRENALQCKHCGGLPPLGYQVNKETKKLELHPEEAALVRYIFQAVLSGKSYNAIINDLYKMGAKTRRGKHFAKNSLYEILRNVKYTGLYTFNSKESKNYAGKRNNHAYKPTEEIIRIEGGIPQIIPTEDFDRVQKILDGRQNKGMHGCGKEIYLLSGKLTCGECGGIYCGDAHHSGQNKLLHVTYRCNNRASRGSGVCRNKPINRDKLEHYVLKTLAEAAFNKNFLPDLIDQYNDKANASSDEFAPMIKALKKKVVGINTKIENLTHAIAESGNLTLIQALEANESEKLRILSQIAEMKQKSQVVEASESQIKSAFERGKLMLQSGELEQTRQLINIIIDRIVIEPDDVKIEFNNPGVFAFVTQAQK
ncbi:MAG: recombinase family protein [Oscillospiraceae bacterium]